MKALCFEAGRLELRELPVPKRGPGEALIRVRMAGICNTDLEIARGYMSWSGVLGHEFVGVVEEADDSSLIGTRVAGEINLACHDCDMCRRGLARHCRKRSVLGILGKDGCFAQYLTLPIQNLHRLPDGLRDRAACFVEPVAACYQILEQVFVDQRDRIAVLGDGKLGQLVARVLREAGAELTLVGKHARKLELARSVGIATASASDLPAHAFDTVVEATGSASGMELALSLLRPRGTLVLKSTYHGKLSLDAAPIVIDELTVIGSRCGPFEPAISALSAGCLSPEPLIDAVFPLDDAVAAFRKAEEPGVMKVLLAMPEVAGSV
ncbi:MAG TPA: alcohol dehydrogenase catalytic domain-containing protein [Polyangiales bacterium]